MTSTLVPLSWVIVLGIILTVMIIGLYVALVAVDNSRIEWKVAHCEAKEKLEREQIAHAGSQQRNCILMRGFENVIRCVLDQRLSTMERLCEMECICKRANAPVPQQLINAITSWGMRGIAPTDALGSGLVKGNPPDFDKIAEAKYPAMTESK